MTASKGKYFNNIIQLCLLKAVLLFSVFLFSGFNEKVQNTYLESTATELVELRNFSTTFDSTQFSKKYSPATSPPFHFDLAGNNYSILLFHLHQVLLVQYKFINGESLCANFSFIHSIFKTLPATSKGKIPPSSIV